MCIYSLSNLFILKILAQFIDFAKMNMKDILDSNLQNIYILARVFSFLCQKQNIYTRKFHLCYIS